jgi:hypothetical protein
MKTIILSIALVCLSACSASAQRKPISFENSNELFNLLNGKWAFGSHDCQNPFIFAVSSDKKSIKVTYKNIDKETKKETDKEFVYKVIEADNLKIRAQVENEKRQTDDEKPVVWDFYFFSKDVFRWQRTDWKDSNFTPAATRCKE